MASGQLSRINGEKKFHHQKLNDGYKRITCYIPPHTLTKLEADMQELDIPASVLVEKIVRNHYGDYLI